MIWKYGTQGHKLKITLLRKLLFSWISFWFSDVALMSNSSAGKAKPRLEGARGVSVWVCWGRRRGKYDMKNAVRRSIYLSNISENTVAFSVCSLICMTWSIAHWVGSLALQEPSARPVLPLLHSSLSVFFGLIYMNPCMYDSSCFSPYHSHITRASPPLKTTRSQDTSLPPAIIPSMAFLSFWSSSSGLSATVTKLWGDMLAWTSHRLSFLRSQVVIVNVTGWSLKGVLDLGELSSSLNCIPKWLCVFQATSLTPCGL